MKPIQMVDLKSQYLRLKNEIDSAILNVLESTAFINGPDVKFLESELNEYLDSKFTIGCANGTDALQIALMALDLHPGDEVITTPFTFIATAEVISLLHLTPKFVDVLPGSFNMDVEQLEATITENTKCIIPVHLYGQSCDMQPIMAIAENHKIAIVEDNAQSVGCNYTFEDGSSRKTGTMGTIGTQSFYPSKNLSCYGDGGALFTQDEALHDNIRMIVNHGSKKKYYNDVVGVNSRLDTIQAAILRIKLKYLDNDTSNRNSAAEYYDLRFKENELIQTPERSSNSTHVFHQYTLKVKHSRNELQTALGEKGIPSMIYYPIPLHLQKAYQTAGYSNGDFPVSERLSEEVISLPMHSELSQDQLDHICDSVNAFYP